MNAASDHQYEALSRFVVTLGKLKGGPEPSDLCIHKALVRQASPEGDSAPLGGKSATNEWLAAKIILNSPQRVLDVGCGFGTLAACISEGSSAQVTGINPAGFAISFGQAYWAQRAQSKPLRLHCAAIGDRIEGAPFDAVTAVESLGYADDLGSAFAWLQSICTDDARIWLLDDWASPGLDQQDPDRVALCSHWRRNALYSREEVIAAAATQGFELGSSKDLSHLVPASRRAPASLRRHALKIAANLSGTSSAGEIAHAFLGGWFLEQLYARGLCRYELLELRRCRDDR